MRAALVLLLASSAALADDAALLRCRAITDATTRLACYDALPLASAGSKPVAAVAPTPVEQFGLEQQAIGNAAQAIESRIAGHFEGWGPKTRLTLANGQVWQIVDDSKGVMEVDNPKVRIRRGALGAFYLEVEGTNRSPRVKRLQ